MKTSKRKRSAKTAPILEAASVDVIAAEPSSAPAAEDLPVTAEMSSPAEPVAEPTIELSEAAVEALVAEPAALEPVVEAVAETVEVAADPVAESVDPMAETVIAEAADPMAETVIAEATDPTAETVIAEATDPTAETVVAEAADLVVAEPAPAGEPIVVLAANCSVKDAAALKTSLCAFGHESIDVTLDVSAVERVDTATMQLLCAFVRDRSGRKQNVTWRGESQALQDAVRLLGVGELLGFESKGVAA
jgi:ABC-type transporter Mla MlaB component